MEGGGCVCGGIRSFSSLVYGQELSGSKSATSYETAQGKALLWKVAGLRGSQSCVCFSAGPGPCLLGITAKEINSPWTKTIWWREFSTAREPQVAPRAKGKRSFLRLNNHRGTRGWLEEREGNSAWGRKSGLRVCDRSVSLCLKSRFTGPAGVCTVSTGRSPGCRRPPKSLTHQSLRSIQ